MSKSPSWELAKRGLLIRLRQLRIWAARVRARLGRIHTGRAEYEPAGVQGLINRANDNLDRAFNTLSKRLDQVIALGRHDPQLLSAILKDLVAAENLIYTVDEIIIPILFSRTPSDPKYDRFILRFLKDINLTRDQEGRSLRPVTCHRQWHPNGLTLDTTFEHPIFVFSPSIRSFHALALLYHEFGHLFCKRVFTKIEHGQLRAEIARLETSAPSRPRTDPVDLYGDEIMADAFAGLVGGAPFLASLCTFYLCKPRRDTSGDHRHPPAMWRIWFARCAGDLGGNESTAPDDPILAAWDAVTHPPWTLARHQVWPPMDAEWASSFLTQFRHVLLEHGILLARGIERTSFPNQPMIDNHKYSIPHVLWKAAQIESDSVEDWRAYREREQKAFVQIGLGPRGSRQRRSP